MRRGFAGLCSRPTDEEGRIRRSEGGLERRVCKEADMRRGDATTAAKLVRGEWEEGSRKGVAGVGR